MICADDFIGYPVDGKVRLVRKIDDVAGFYVCDNDPIYAVVVGKSEEREKETETACLKLWLNAKLRPVNVSEKNEKNDELLFDIIRLTNWTNDRDFIAFVEICEMHARESESLSFEGFFYSLAELFRQNREQSKLNAYGLFCELAFVEKISTATGNSVDLTSFWQLDGKSSKYDFVLPGGNIEIKSATKKAEVLIKHDQLFNSDKNYLVAVCAERNPSGESLKTLADRLLHQENCFTTLQSRIELNRRIMQIDEKDLAKRITVRFIRGFEAGQINPFDELSDRVSQLSYRLDLADVEYQDVLDLVQKMLQG